MTTPSTNFGVYNYRLSTEERYAQKYVVEGVRHVWLKRKEYKFPPNHN